MLALGGGGGWWAVNKKRVDKEQSSFGWVKGGLGKYHGVKIEQVKGLPFWQPNPPPVWF